MYHQFDKLACSLVSSSDIIVNSCATFTLNGSHSNVSSSLSTVCLEARCTKQEICNIPYLSVPKHDVPDSVSIASLFYNLIFARYELHLSDPQVAKNPLLLEEIRFTLDTLSIE